MFVALVAGGELGTWTFALLAAAVPAGLVAWAGPGSRRVSRWIPLGLLIGLESVTIALLLGRNGSSATVALGLPGNALWLLGGLILAPIVLVSWAHAVSAREDRRGPRHGVGGP